VPTLTLALSVIVLAWREAGGIRPSDTGLRITSGAAMTHGSYDISLVALSVAVAIVTSSTFSVARSPSE